MGRKGRGKYGGPEEIEEINMETTGEVHVLDEPESKLVDELVNQTLEEKMGELGVDVAVQKIKSGVYRIAGVELTFVLEKNPQTFQQQAVVYRAGNMLRDVDFKSWLDHDLKNILSGVDMVTTHTGIKSRVVDMNEVQKK